MNKREPRITKIVLTGGPSAGKTTGLSWIQNAFSKLGYTVLFVPETATELITGGVAPWTCATNLDYQRVQMRLQLDKEKVFEQAARTMKAEKLLIVCDRGAMDNRAYMNDEEFAAVLADVGMTEAELMGRYDAVFHLVTAAKGAERFYTTANNQARTETVEAAAALDDRLIAAWTGHPQLHVIDNSTDFADKLIRLIAEIRGFLGESGPWSVKRKFLIEYPDLRWLRSLPNCQRSDITQTYLIAKAGDELRIRHRRENGGNAYYKIFRRRLGGASSVEIEERLSQEEYFSLLMEEDPTKRPIRKTRYGMNWQDRYYEIDIYPFWQDKAIVEVELHDREEAIPFPKELKVIREVTDDEAYNNAALAQR